MTTRTYYGRIRLNSGGHFISVSASATSNHAAKQVIEAQFSGQIKSWNKQMSLSPC